MTVNGVEKTPSLWVNSSRLRLATGVDGGNFVEVVRVTPIDDAIVKFRDGAVLTSADLNSAALQVLYRQQEIEDLYDRSLTAAAQRVAAAGGVTVQTEAVLQELVQTILNDDVFSDLNTKLDEVNSLAEQLVATASQVSVTQENLRAASERRVELMEEAFRTAARRAVFADSAYRASGAPVVDTAVVTASGGGSAALLNAKLPLARPTVNLSPDPLFASMVVGTSNTGVWSPQGSGYTVLVEDVTDGVARLRYTGTPSGPNIGILTSYQPFSALERGGLAASIYAKIVSLSGPVDYIDVWLNSRKNGGSTGGTASSVFKLEAADGEGRISAALANIPADHDEVRFRVIIHLTTLSPIDLTLELSEPQLEDAAGAGDITPFVAGSRLAGEEPRAISEPTLHEFLAIGEGGGVWFSGDTGSTPLTFTGGASIRAEALVAFEGTLSWEKKNALAEVVSPVRLRRVDYDDKAGQFYNRELSLQAQNSSNPHSFAYGENRTAWYQFETRAGENDAVKGTAGITDRSELLFATGAAVNGQDAWFSTTFAVQYDEAPTGWAAIMQLVPDPDSPDISKSPAVVAEFNGQGDFIIATRTDAANPTTVNPSYTQRWSTVLPVTGLSDPRLLFHRLVMRVRTGWNGDGQLQVWFNGEEVLNLTGVSIGYNDPSGPSPKVGIYRQATSETLRVIHANPEFVADGGTLLDRVAAPLPIS